MSSPIGKGAHQVRRAPRATARRRDAIDALGRAHQVRAASSTRNRADESRRTPRPKAMARAHGKGARGEARAPLLPFRVRRPAASEGLRRSSLRRIAEGRGEEVAPRCAHRPQGPPKLSFCATSSSVSVVARAAQAAADDAQYVARRKSSRLKALGERRQGRWRPSRFRVRRARRA